MCDNNRIKIAVLSEIKMWRNLRFLQKKECVCANQLCLSKKKAFFYEKN